MAFGRILGAAAVAAFAVLNPAQAAEPLKIRVGWVVTPSELPPIMFAKEGIAKHLGVSYTLDAMRFQGTPPMITALAAEELDITPLAYSTFATAIQNAGMEDLRIIADEFQDGVSGYYTNEYMVLKDGPIKTVADLKGRIAASNGVGSAVDMALRVMLRTNKLEDKRDLTIIEVGFPNMRAVLAERKTDLISAVAPFTFDPALRDIARTLFTQKDAVGTTQMTIFTARAPYLAKNRAAVVDFMEDALRALHWYVDPANHDEVVKIVANYTKQPPERFQSWVFTKSDYYRNPDGIPDLDALQKNVDMQNELGFLKASFDVKKYADLSIIQEAGKRLK